MVPNKYNAAAPTANSQQPTANSKQAIPCPDRGAVWIARNLVHRHGLINQTKPSDPFLSPIYQTKQIYIPDLQMDMGDKSAKAKEVEENELRRDAPRPLSLLQHSIFCNTIELEYTK
ncbi:predicted protein [Histoplasma capsulatum var. duboisii H88]|uniref:Predicted protein n=1 Tax=Ajellomyces capsulatus (strain H88) TaxID=544711 RepID=F0UUY5_AJEC8|nr:predicted protein [Histoplasma capsulatum var. duboisii H88]